jgi:hypothetical protein
VEGNPWRAAHDQRRPTLKKKATELKKLSLRRETLTALRQGRLEDVVGGRYSWPPAYTCPECALP